MALAIGLALGLVSAADTCLRIWGLYEAYETDLGLGWLDPIDNRHRHGNVLFVLAQKPDGVSFLCSYRPGLSHPGARPSETSARSMNRAWYVCLGQNAKNAE